MRLSRDTAAANYRQQLSRNGQHDSRGSLEMLAEVDDPRVKGDAAERMENPDRRTASIASSSTAATPILILGPRKACGAAERRERRGAANDSSAVEYNRQG